MWAFEYYNPETDRNLFYFGYSEKDAMRRYPDVDFSKLILIDVE